MPPLSREASRQETPDATPTEDVNSAHLDAELSSLRAELNRRRESEAAALRRANVAEAQADSLLEECRSSRRRSLRRPSGFSQRQMQVFIS